MVLIRSSPGWFFEMWASREEIRLTLANVETWLDPDFSSRADLPPSPRF